MNPFEVIAHLLLVSMGGLLILPVFLYSGYRQFRDGRGTWLRYLAVSIAMTLFSLAPAYVAVPLRIAGRPADELVLSALLATFLCTVSLTRFLHPPGYWKLTGKSLDEVRDPAFLQMVRELAGRIGIRTPVVRLLPSISGDLMTHAAAGGLPAPSLVVSDGILHRLAPEERDAVVAHELAHIRNHSLWLLALAAPLAGVGAILATGPLHAGSAVLFGVALHTGLFRIVSRWLELDSDRRAADANGYPTTFSALAKIHAILPLHNDGFRSLLLYATATHPSRDERLAALARRMPQPPPESADWSRRTAARRRFAMWTAVAIWLLLLALMLWTGVRDAESWWPTLIGVAVILAPLAFQLWAVKAEYRQSQKRMQPSEQKLGWKSWAAFALALVGSCLYFLNEDAVRGVVADSVPGGEATFALALLALLFGGFVLMLLLGTGVGFNKRFELEIATALQQHDWEAALDIGRRQARRVARSPAARHNIAIAKLQSGQRNEATADLEQLRADDKTLKQTWITLCLLYFDDGRADKALEVAADLQRLSQRDSAAHLLKSKALRELGRLDEAAAELEAARKLAPGDATLLAGDTMLLIARGDLAAARSAINELERRSPGDTILPFIEAEFAFAAADLTAARRHLDRAAELVRVNPFTMSEQRLQRLQARLAQKDPTVPLEIVDWNVGEVAAS